MMVFTILLVRQKNIWRRGTQIIEKWGKWKFPATYYQIMVGGLEIDLEKDNN